MEKKIYVILGNPISDIGKGRLAACVACALPSSKVIKIDPVLNRVNTGKNDLTKGKGKTADANTYQNIGLAFNKDQMLVQGNILFNFLENTNYSEKGVNKLPRIRFTDFSYYFAERIVESFDIDTKNMIVEVGGSITDPEVVCIPKALRIAAKRLDCKLEYILLSYFDYTEDKQQANPIKTRHVTYAVEQAIKIYGMPSRVFMRSRDLEVQVERNMNSLVKKISREAFFEDDQLFYLPNFDDINDQIRFIKKNLTTFK